MGHVKLSTNPYPFLQAGSGTDKLASSAINPLIAQARGYWTVTPDEAKQAAKTLNLGHHLGVPAQQFRSTVTGSDDTLIMPWHRLDDAYTCGLRGSFPTPITHQYRPSNPTVDEKGKVAKYVNQVRRPTVIGVHPATPPSWIQNPARVMIVEGLLKADSALSAYLGYLGVKLDSKPKDDTLKARLKLRKAMEQVAEKDRVLILEISGVGNWKDKPEWALLKGKNVPVTIAFDGDLSTNAAVWKQGKELQEFLYRVVSAPQVKFIVLPEVDDYTRNGLDDYLAEGGRWEDLEGMVADLPEVPEGSATPSVELGDWFVGQDGTGVYERNLVDGHAVDLEVNPIGGRVVKLVAHRPLTDAERRTGKPTSQTEIGGSGAELEVEIELSFRDSSDSLVSGMAQGPIKILQLDPRAWGVTVPAKISPNIICHSAWPPKNGMKWLQAIKAHRKHETETEVHYETMGYLPNNTGLPTYYIGDQAVTMKGVEYPSRVPVSTESFPQSNRYGLGEIDAEFGSVEWKAQVREDIEAIVEAFYGDSSTKKGYIMGGAWSGCNHLETGRALAHLVIGSAMLPTLPIQPSAVLMLTGGPHTGKTWTASRIADFWGEWGEGELPGSASDTMAATEIAISYAPLWVIDDLAPGTSKLGAERSEQMVADIVRAVHNRSGKARATKDLALRAVRSPKAMLVVTAENSLSVPSARSRMVEIQFYNSDGYRTLGLQEQVEKAENLGDLGVNRRITTAMIQYVLSLGEALDWERMSAGLEKALLFHQKMLTEALKVSSLNPGGQGESTFRRIATIGAQLSLALSMFQSLGNYVGVDCEAWQGVFGPYETKAATASKVGRELVPALLYSQNHVKNASTGTLMLQGLRDLLGSGGAHVSALGSMGAPSKSIEVCSALGWQDSSGHNPKSPRIGTLVKVGDDQVVLIKSRVAFKLIRQILDSEAVYGLKAESAWRAVHSEGLSYRGLTLNKGSDGARKNTAQVTRNGETAYGVPIALETILDGSEH